MSRPAQEAFREQGFTLTELMVVVAILAVLVAVAIPSFSGNKTGQAVEQLAEQLARDFRLAHMEAIAKRDDRLVILSKSSYQITDSNLFAIHQREVPANTVIHSVLNATAVPGTSYTVPETALKDTDQQQIRFYSTGGMAVIVDGADYAATIFVESDDANNKKRIIIYRGTSFAKVYDGW